MRGLYLPRSRSRRDVAHRSRMPWLPASEARAKKRSVLADLDAEPSPPAAQGPRPSRTYASRRTFLTGSFPPRGAVCLPDGKVRHTSTAPSKFSFSTSTSQGSRKLVRLEFPPPRLWLAKCHSPSAICPTPRLRSLPGSRQVVRLSELWLAGRSSSLLIHGEGR